MSDMGRQSLGDKAASAAKASPTVSLHRSEGVTDFSLSHVWLRTARLSENLS
jgi:hypothetical protein